MKPMARIDALMNQPDIGRMKRGGGDLGAVATEFEGVMLQELVKAMRATTTLDGNEPKNDQMVEHLIDEALAGHLAKAGGIGLADYIVGDSRQQGADDTLRFQGRVGAAGTPSPTIGLDSLEHRLRFPLTRPEVAPESEVEAAPAAPGAPPPVRETAPAAGGEDYEGIPLR